MKNISNIAHVISYYPPHLGGMENCAEKIVNLQRKNNKDVFVYTSSIGVNKKKQVKNVQYLNAFEIAHTPIFISLFTSLMKLPKDSIIHLHVSQAFTPEMVFLVSKLKKIPYVAHIHLDVDPSGFFGFLLAPYKKILLAHVLRSANKIICLSENQKNLISKKYKIRKNKIFVIPNGVGSEYFIKRKKTINNSPRLLFVGRLSAQKNLSHLINSVALMKNKISVDIVGDGEERRILQRLINEKGLKNIKLNGKKTGKDLLKFYKKSDVFVLTSIKEGVSLAMLEAMAAGLPIVGLNSDGVSDLVRGCGVLVDSPDPKKFASSLDSFVSNKKMIARYSEKASVKARSYTWTDTASKIKEVYEKV